MNNNDIFHKAGILFTRLYYFFPLEAFLWLGIIVALFIYNPSMDKHMSLCVFNRLGLEFCPGCGLGRSISYLLDGDLRHSLAMHPLGIPAFLILSSRMINLFHNFFKNNKSPNSWQTF